MTSSARVVEVDPARLPRWVENLAARHGAVQRRWAADGLTFEAADGTRAVVGPWAAQAEVPEGDPGDEAWVQPPLRLGLVLVRRGGYAVGAAVGADLTTHHCGTRYVQSRTAAGGWSQQRFARRRGNQADALVGAVVQRAAPMLGATRLDGIVLAGDRALLRQVLQDRRLQALVDLPRRTFPDIPDPRFRVLQDVLRRGRALQIMLTDPEPGAVSHSS